ncbi:hypothetical protein C0989_000443 [Termitomyces sp. Mn162]|nr:hypothetical protein C0989_000443 [Termitomyces sp. Mn162]
MAMYRTTQTSGQMERTTKSGMLRRAAGGVDGPPMAVVAPRAVSRARYVPSANMRKEKMWYGCGMVRCARMTDRGTHDETAPRAVLDDLGRDDGVGEETPEESSHKAGVEGGENNEGCAALAEECAGGDGVEGESDGVDGEEGSELDAAHGGLASVGEPDEDESEDKREAACNVVCNVAQRLVKRRRDEALRVDADAGRVRAGRGAVEDGGVGRADELAVEEIAPAIRRHRRAQRPKVAKHSAKVSSSSNPPLLFSPRDRTWH